MAAWGAPPYSSSPRAVPTGSPPSRTVRTGHRPLESPSPPSRTPVIAPGWVVADASAAWELPGSDDPREDPDGAPGGIDELHPPSAITAHIASPASLQPRFDPERPTLTELAREVLCMCDRLRFL